VTLPISLRHSDQTTFVAPLASLETTSIVTTLAYPGVPLALSSLHMEQIYSALTLANRLRPSIKMDLADLLLAKPILSLSPMVLTDSAISLALKITIYTKTAHAYPHAILSSQLKVSATQALSIANVLAQSQLIGFTGIALANLLAFLH